MKIYLPKLDYMIIRRFKTIQKEVAKATNFRSSAVTIRAKKIHEAELAGDSDALDKALKRHIDKSKKIDRQQDDQITHYDSKADDIMEKYFPTSWQHPGRQK